MLVFYSIEVHVTLDFQRFGKIMHSARYVKAFIAHAPEQLAIIRRIAFKKLPELAVREMMAGGRFSYIRRMLEYIHRVKYFRIFAVAENYAIIFIYALQTRALQRVKAIL